MRSDLVNRILKPTGIALLALTAGAIRAAGIADAGFPMVDPALDDPAKPWCYFTHPVSCIGMPWQPDAIGIQVTPEGNIYTGRAEFCVFWGAESKPLACRQRQFLDGYIPVVSDFWTISASPHWGLNFMKREHYDRFWAQLFAPATVVVPRMGAAQVAVP